MMIYNGNGGSQNTKMLERGTIIKERIFRTLLNNPSGIMTKYRLAKESQCTYPSVHRLLGELEKRKLVTGTKINNFEVMFEIWQKWKIKNNSREYLVKDPVEILRRMPLKHKLTYALTTYQAENLVQNYLISSRIDFYIEQEDKLKWHEIFIKNGALVGKGNVRIIMADEHVFYNSFNIRDLHVVSVPQLIVDLLREGGVCIEAAHNLMEKMK